MPESLLSGFSRLSSKRCKQDERDLTAAKCNSGTVAAYSVSHSTTREKAEGKGQSTLCLLRDLHPSAHDECN